MGEWGLVIQSAPLYVAVLGFRGNGNGNVHWVFFGHPRHEYYYYDLMRSLSDVTSYRPRHSAYK